MRHQETMKEDVRICLHIWQTKTVCYIPNPFNVVTSHFPTSQGMIFYITCHIHQFSYCLYLVQLINVWAYTIEEKKKGKKQTKHNSISWHGNKQVKRQITVLWGVMHWTIFWLWETTSWDLFWLLGNCSKVRNCPAASSHKTTNCF